MAYIEAQFRTLPRQSEENSQDLRLEPVSALEPSKFKSVINNPESLLDSLFK